MAVALSPWPSATATQSRARATERLGLALFGRPGDPAHKFTLDPDAERLGPVAGAMVEQYAPAAPQALKDEAVIRFAGYLAEQNYGAVEQETLGPASTTYVTNHAAAFRNCGAAMLLSRWRVRRAGAIG